VNSRVLLLAALPVLLPGVAWAQEPLTIQELELEYSSAVQRHQAAFDAWEALESRFQRALDSLSAATESGSSSRINAAFTLTQQLEGEVRLQERRVGELADGVRASRSRLLAALDLQLDELVDEVEATQDPEEHEELVAILNDRNLRYLQLRAEEDPETTLEPMRELTVDPRDTPEDILRKAQAMDVRGNRIEAQLAVWGQRLDELRRDQRRARQVRDFMAGVERYDDTRLPVVSPPNRTGPPPEPGERPPGADTLSGEARAVTLEERIERLESLVEELTRRLEAIRDKAERFRRLARGGGG
jgi:archaellum component FlaC